MTVSEFLSRLDSVKGSHGQWTARCPAHDDRRASLSVSVGEGGRVLLNCHAGCSAEDICAALGLTVKDLFTEDKPKEHPRESRQIVETYPYHHDLQKIRYSDKSFLWRRPDGKGGWIWNRQGVPNALFQAGELTDVVAIQETLLFTIDSSGQAHAEGTSWKRDREYAQEMAASVSAPKREDCKEWVLSALDDAGGSMPSKELEDSAKAAGYSFRTLRRAKDDLKTTGQIKYFQTGSPKEKVWHIQRVEQQQFTELPEGTPTPWDK